MEREGDNPVPQPLAAPGPVTAQNIHVTPENVVALAALFRDCADILAPEVRQLGQDLWLNEPWMSDLVSKWAAMHFNVYFVSGANSFANIVQAEYDQHVAVSLALIATAQQYGLTEELTAAGFTEVGPR